MLILKLIGTNVKNQVLRNIKKRENKKFNCINSVLFHFKYLYTRQLAEYKENGVTKQMAVDNNKRTSILSYFILRSYLKKNILIWYQNVLNKIVPLFSLFLISMDNNECIIWITIVSVQ